MRRLVILSIFILGTFALKAQDAAPTFKVTPSEIDALTENVIIEFDVTGSAVEGLTDVYIWSWSPQLGSPSEMLICYDGNSSNWGSISENAKLTPVDGQPNKFILALPLTVTRNTGEVTFNNVAELFGLGDTPGKIKEFGFLLRSQDGSKQTPGDMATSVTLLPLEFTPSYFRTFPAKVSTNDVVTAYLDLSFVGMSDTDGAGENEKLKIIENVTAVVTLLDNVGTAIVTSEPLETNFTTEEEHAFTFLAEKVGEFAEGKTIADVAQCRIVFSGEVYNQDSTTETVSTKTFEFDFQVYE